MPSGQLQVQCTVAGCACPLRHYAPRPSAHIRALRSRLTVNGVEIKATARVKTDVSYERDVRDGFVGTRKEWQAWIDTATSLHQRIHDQRLECFEVAANRARATTPPPHPDDLWLEWMTTFNREVAAEIERTRVPVPDTQKRRYVNAIIVAFYLLVIALFLVAVSAG